MGQFNEEFARCTECDNAYFKPEQTVLIKKDAGFNEPVIVGGHIIYKCASCGHKQYEED